MCFVSLALTSLSLGEAHGASGDLDPEIGWDYGVLETGRGAALSGADRAQSSSLSALFSNPANMVASRIYHVGALASIWPEAKRQSYGAAVVDSSTSSTSLAGGLSAAWTIQDTDGLDRRGSDLRLALAFPFSHQFRMGLGGRYLAFRQDGDGPLGPSYVSGGLEGDSIVRGFGMEAGVTLQPNRSIAISLVGVNLNSPGHGFAPSSVGGGVGFGNDELTLEGDLVTDFNTWDENTLRAMLGGEYLVSGHIPLRAGYRYDEGPHSHSGSLGLGYIDRSMALEIGVRRTLKGPSSTAVILSFTYHVESSGTAESYSESY